MALTSTLPTGGAGFVRDFEVFVGLAVGTGDFFKDSGFVLTEAGFDVFFAGETTFSRVLAASFSLTGMAAIFFIEAGALAFSPPEVAAFFFTTEEILLTFLEASGDLGRAGFATSFRSFSAREEEDEVASSADFTPLEASFSGFTILLPVALTAADVFVLAFLGSRSFDVLTPFFSLRSAIPTLNLHIQRLIIREIEIFKIVSFYRILILLWLSPEAHVFCRDR
ncbi:MAG: hypothetical protein HQL31_05805 [Planctomycetes bacterium]|nr:hypothetical protein [Planctomycetota bacterium]